jgi:signal transduction histidine kinase
MHVLAAGSDGAHDAIAGEMAGSAGESEQLRLLFQKAPGFIAVLRLPGHVFEIANEAFLELLGRREVLGARLADALPEALEQGLARLLDEACRTGKPYVGRDYRLELNLEAGAMPAVRFINFVFQPFFARPGGEVSGVFLQGHDVTDEHDARQALMEADRNKDRFIATLAHELRNPLAPIRMAARLLMSPALSPDVIAITAPIVMRQVDHMGRMLDDLLDSARIANGQVLLVKEPMLSDRLVGMAMETAAPKLEAKMHRVTVTHHDGPIALSGDPMRLTQVLVNVLTNAAKYTDPKGRIRIDTRRDGEQLLIAVEDNGIGLSRAAQERILTCSSRTKRRWRVRRAGWASDWRWPGACSNCMAAACRSTAMVRGRDRYLPSGCRAWCAAPQGRALMAYWLRARDGASCWSTMRRTRMACWRAA